jgi:hypothetical protein
MLSEIRRRRKQIPLSIVTHRVSRPRGEETTRYHDEASALAGASPSLTC